MKKNRMLRSIGLIDEKYVEEASPENAKNIRENTRFKKYRPLMLAACLWIILASFALWLFVPFSTKAPSVKEHSDSEYYTLIKKLNEYYAEKPEYYNNFDALFSGLSDIFGAKKESIDVDFDSVLEGGSMNGAVADGAPVPTAKPESSTDGLYSEEITDNQVAGVAEADLIKRTNKHIFYLNHTQLNVYSIAGSESKLVSKINVQIAENLIFGQCLGFYLTEDGKTVNLIYSFTAKESSENITDGQSKPGLYSSDMIYYEAGSNILLVSFDVSSPEEGIKEKGRTVISGGYVSSRMVDGKILLVSTFRTNKNIDFTDERTFLPQIDYGNGPESIPISNIFAPDELTSGRYTVVTKLDAENGMKADDAYAFLSYSGDVFVSKDSVYLTRSFNDKEKEDGLYINCSMTEISRLRYTGKKFEYKGQVAVEGYIKDQYSLDEYEGILRVVTTTETYTTKEYRSFLDGVYASEIEGRSVTNASLYCVDISNMTVTASVERFAPDYETVRSVRFDKTAAYVCTSVQLSDPVFFFDLSDLKNITVKDTGTIEGFSEFLVNFGNGYLLGIGVGSDWSTLKIEVYEEGKDDVVSVCKYEVKQASFSRDYKSYLIDRENGFVGIGYSTYDANYASRYLLLGFDNYRLVPLVDVELFGDNTAKRAVYIDGYLYMFADNNFLVEKIG